jgi:hypothetical protein
MWNGKIHTCISEVEASRGPNWDYSVEEYYQKNISPILLKKCFDLMYIKQLGQGEGSPVYLVTDKIPPRG